MTKWIGIVILIYVGIRLLMNRSQQGYEKITPPQAKEKLKEKKSTVLLDVRTPEEYAQGHIPKSKLLPLNLLKQKIESVVSDKDKEIIVYCRSGSRSKGAVNSLLKMGYKNVYDLGGIINWPYEIK